MLRDKDRASWESFMTIPRFTDDSPLHPGSTVAKRDERAYRRNEKKAEQSPERYSKDNSDQAWSVYEKLRSE